MALSSFTAAGVATKKLYGKSTTDARASIAAEVYASTIQLNASTIFADAIPVTPTPGSLNNGVGSVINNIVEYIEFDLRPIAASSYTTQEGTPGDTNDTGTGPTNTLTAETHAYALHLPADYVTYSANAKKGTGYFINAATPTGSNGALQIVPANMSNDASDPYAPVLYNGSGNVISATNAIDWNLDAYSGILFIQDPHTAVTGTPTKLRAYIYVGTFVSESLGGSSTQADSAASASVAAASDNNPYYITFVSQSSGTHPFRVDTDLTYNPSTNILSTTASWAQNALTASNISKAFTTGTPSADGQIVISKGSGQVTGSSLLSYSDSNNGQLTIGGATDGVSINPSNFTVNSNTFNYVFGNTPYNGIVFSGLDNQGTATVTFNISASFTAPTTFASSINSTFDDQFILLASGSADVGGNRDSGIVFEYGDKIGSGSALFFDTNNSKRLSFRYSASIADTGMTPLAYINMTFKSGMDGINSTTDVDTKFTNAGGGSEGDGFMFIDAAGNIYIKA